MPCGRADPGTSDNWSSGTNWTGLVGESYPGQVAAAADIVTIGAAAAPTSSPSMSRLRPLVPLPSREGTVLRTRRPCG